MLSIMKTFLNVLYRRILYKIPLKFLLILLAIFCLMFAYSKADYELYDADENSITLPTNNREYTLQNENFPNYICIVAKHDNLAIYDDNTFSLSPERVMLSNYDTYCTDDEYVYLRNNYWPSSISYYYYDSPKLSSLQCQTEYSLIPISSVDQLYCTSNNLCPSSDCPSYTWDLTPWVSNIWINDIFHPGAFNIIMNIPEEISRDYAYTNSWHNFNLDIEWYNVDYEKMQSVIDKQSYIPTNEDFQNIILLIWPYWKIIIFFVFLFILWAWIKKPFKSKL